MGMENFSLSDVAAVTRNNDDNNMGGASAWWLIILFAMIWGWGGNGFGNNGGNGLTQAEMQAGFNNSEVIGKLDRLGDGVSSLGYQISRDMCTGFANGVAATNAAAAQAQQCCCETNRNIDQLRYDGALNTAAINANVTEQTQKILDTLCGNRMADMQNQINQLQLQNAVSGVVRYPMSTTYGAGTNPFFNSGCCC